MTLPENIFYTALRIRMAEEKIVEIYPSDKIQSPVHLSIGQEHHIAAFCEALRKEDQIYSTYRSHALYLARGGSLKAMFAELYGKYDGIAKGKGGSMHLCASEVGLMGSAAIVGAVLPHALGAAYAKKIRNQDGVSIALVGDGATEEGVFYECLNFASLKDLPIFFVIENNGLAIHTHIGDRQSYNLSDLARAFNIGYIKEEDGFNMESVYEKTKEIIINIEEKNRPFIFEIGTYRYKAHVGIEDDFDKGYRKEEEFREWYSRDPLVIEDVRIERYRDDIHREIAEAVEFAEHSEFPSHEELLKDVYQ